MRSTAAPDRRGASLQELEQLEPSYSGKAVTVDRDFGVLMDHSDVVPGLELFGDLGMRFFISGAQVCQSLS
jgi:hypothetical protein